MRIGSREADMLMDGLIALRGTWEDRGPLDPSVSAAEMARMERLMDKLREHRAREAHPAGKGRVLKEAGR